jgi:hypothetical protein
MMVFFFFWKHIMLSVDVLVLLFFLFFLSVTYSVFKKKKTKNKELVTYSIFCQRKTPTSKQVCIFSFNLCTYLC